MQRTRICFGDGTLGRQLVLSLEIDSDSIFGLGEYDHLIQDGAPQLCLSVYKPLETAMNTVVESVISTINHS